MWNETGVGRHVRNLVRRIAEKDTKNEYVLFFYEIPQTYFPKNFKIAETPIRWHTFKEQFVLPFIFLKENLDLLHVPHFNVPVLYPKKFLVTVHDLTLLRVKTGRATTLPYFYYLIKHFAFKIVLFSAVKRAQKIFTVTQFVKKDIIDTFGVPENKILLTPNAVSEKFKPSSEEQIFTVLKKYNIKRPYLFYIGNAHPHKNLERLIQAFQNVAQKHPDLSLVLAGKKYFFYERLEKEVQESPIVSKLNFVGFVADEDLPALYSGAEAFVNPSLYEGFGIQLLESFACGTKVVCSNATSLPEVGKDAAIYFNPVDVVDIANKIMICLEKTDSSKIDLGYARVKAYSWEDSVAVVLQVYDEFR